MPTDQQYRNALRDCVRGMNGIEVRDADDVDRTLTGAWVQVWMYVSNNEMEEGDL